MCGHNMHRQPDRNGMLAPQKNHPVIVHRQGHRAFPSIFLTLSRRILIFDGWGLRSGETKLLLKSIKKASGPDLPTYEISEPSDSYLTDASQIHTLHELSGENLTSVIGEDF
jgi:hypothetical protein